MLSPTQLPTSYLPSSPALGTPRLAYQLPSTPPIVPSGFTPLQGPQGGLPSFPPQLPTLGTHPPHGGYKHCQCGEKKNDNLMPLLLMSLLPMLMGGKEGDDDKGMNSMMMMLPMLMGGLGGNSQGGGMEKMLPMMMMALGGGDKEGGSPLTSLLPMLMGGLGGNTTSSANALASAVSGGANTSANALASAFAGNGSNPLASLLTA
ncbi:MAG: hypothetical protein ACKO34_01680 [Vampirovibrionales bacterium]